MSYDINLKISQFIFVHLLRTQIPFVHLYQKQRQRRRQQLRVLKYTTMKDTPMMSLYVGHDMTYKGLFVYFRMPGSTSNEPYLVRHKGHIFFYKDY